MDEVIENTGFDFDRPDEVPETAKHITELLEEARRADAEVQRKAAGAAYAGESDPHRHEDDADEDEAPAATETPAPIDAAGRSGQ